MTKPRDRIDLAISKLRARYKEMMETDLASFHCALIYSGGNLVSIGFNKQNVNSFVTTFAHHENVKSIHAECSAILKVRKKVDLRGSRMYVAKLDRSGLVGNSRPCAMCERVLQLYGIKRVYYTTSTAGMRHFNLNSPSDTKDALADETASHKKCKDEI